MLSPANERLPRPRAPRPRAAPRAHPPPPGSRDAAVALPALHPPPHPRRTRVPGRRVRHAGDHLARPRGDGTHRRGRPGDERPQQERRLLPADGRVLLRSRRGPAPGHSHPLPRRDAARPRSALRAWRARAHLAARPGRFSGGRDAARRREPVEQARLPGALRGLLVLHRLRLRLHPLGPPHSGAEDLPARPRATGPRDGQADREGPGYPVYCRGRVSRQRDPAIREDHPEQPGSLESGHRGAVRPGALPARPLSGPVPPLRRLRVR
jgi:hypothetical protein